MNEYTLLGKLLFSVLLGLLIGYEREKSNKIAGLRTHTLVALGSTIFTILSIEGFDRFIGQTNYDPSRIISNILVGIGFIGAGTILKTESRIVGTTTAASLWLISAIGVAVGLGFYLLAGVSALIVYIVLALLWKFEKKF